jgi:hypothetical protein
MICRENTFDGKNRNQKETRVKINEGNGGQNFGRHPFAGMGFWGNGGGGNRRDEFD